jgi:FMN-dependent NADH-azoreductase
MLSNQFVTDWTVHHPDSEVLRRDLAKQTIPYIDDTWVTAKFTAKDEYTPELADAIQLSDRLIDEFLSADAYILSTPMYNLSIPAVLKSYIDYIVRPNRTFAIVNGNYQGLVQGKKMLIVTARGSDFRPGSNLAPLDFQEPYLKAIFNFIGITDVQFVNANGLNAGLREQSLAEAQQMLRKLAIDW